MGYELTTTGHVKVEENAKPRVLVIEDDPGELNRVSHILGQNGFTVVPAGSLDNVAETAAQNKCDVVLFEKGVTSNNNGVVYGGQNLCRDVVERTRQAGLDTKVVLSTLLLRPEDIGAYGSVGFYDVIAKPASDNHLVSTLQDIVSRNDGPIAYKNITNNVLIVDDYADMRDLLSDALRQVGSEGNYSAANVMDAISILDKQRDNIEVVVCDWGLPQIDKLLDRAGELGKQVVVMSGYPEEYILRQYASEVDFLAKIDAYFKKPFDITEFAKTVQSLSEPDSPLRMPDVRARYDGEPGERILVTGLSTAGKSTEGEIVSRRIPSLVMPARLTTRGLRDGEKDGQGLYHLSDDAFTMCEILEGIHPYVDGGNRYSADTPDPRGADQVIPVCAVGFKEMASLYPGAHRVYLGISPDTMAERLKGRPGDETERLARAMECLRTFSDYFPVSGSDGVFHEVIRTDHNGSRIANTLYSARRLARYIAAQRN